jgi:hypothetical protein
MSSSSTAPMKKRRCVRIATLTPKLCHLLLKTHRLQPPPPTMAHLMRCKLIVMAVARPIGCKVVVVTVETRPLRLRLPHQKGSLQGCAPKNLRIIVILRCCTIDSSVKENGDGGVESVISYFLSCLLNFLLIFISLYYLVDPL